MKHWAVENEDVLLLYIVRCLRNAEMLMALKVRPRMSN